jgi:shikimate dehydrogenase
MKKYGLIGKKLSHSFSPNYFKQKFISLGLNEISYDAIELTSIEQITSLLSSGIDGFNVTIPYKQDIIAYLNELDEAAVQIGAVNCVKKIAKGYKGFNTDYIGFEVSLMPLLNSGVGYKALVLGNGGATKAVCFALTKLGIPFEIVSRQNGFLSYEDLNAKIIKEHLILINTTPLGMSPIEDNMPTLPYHAITEHHILYDLIYNPAKTKFLIEGELRNAKIKNGQEMLYIQADESWNIWNNKD